jgi:hypothetical protein
VSLESGDRVDTDFSHSAHSLEIVY